jgi:hypothetical protein
MNCNKTSNNKYFDCPALMSDGRIMTDYRSSTTLNDMIRLNNKTLSSYDYRQFLIHNGENIMKINENFITNKNSCKSGKLVEVPFAKTCNYNTEIGTCMKTNQRMGIGLKNMVDPNINTCGVNQGSKCYFNDAEKMNVQSDFYNGMNSKFSQFSSYN